MKNQNVQTLDKMSRKLFQAGCATDLGIPGWIVTEMLTRENNPFTPEKLFCIDVNVDGPSSNILSEYADKKGYSFSWGHLSECIEFLDLGDGEELIGRFEFSPADLLKSFPNSAMIQDLLTWMYRLHPLHSEKFLLEEAIGDWFTLSFSAYDELEIARLRRWLAITFIPKIWPDLLMDGMRIIEIFKVTVGLETQDDGYDVFVEHHRNQLCVDPTQLSFFNKS
jgi:hypothetical protein